MKKILLALTAVAALTGSANAADLAARPYTKAPPPIAQVYNWTGFYVFGGGGGGLWAADQSVQVTSAKAVLVGLVPSVPVTIGNSTIHGSSVYWLTASSAA